MPERHIPVEYCYCVCHIIIRVGERVIFNEYVFLNPKETPNDPDEMPEAVTRHFKMFKKAFAAETKSNYLNSATVWASTRVHCQGQQIKHQRFRGFNYAFFQCPDHPDITGAWCPHCGAQLLRILIENDYIARPRGYTK